MNNQESNSSDSVTEEPPTVIAEEGLRILFWNARSFLRRKEQLEKELKNIDICICVESWLDESDLPSDVNFPGFLTLREDRVISAGGGIVFFIRNNIAYLEIDSLYTPNELFQTMGITITNLDQKTNIIACYKPPDLTLLQDEWDSLLSPNNLGNSYILLGDFNAHNQGWNCRTNNTDGRRLLHSIVEKNCFLHNSNTLTRYDVAHDSWSNIDLILTEPSIAHLIQFRVNDVSWGSDHLPIFVNYSIKKHIYVKKSFKLHSKRTNWDKFYNDVDKQNEKFYSYDYNNLSPTDKYAFFSNIIPTSLKAASPQKRNFQCISIVIQSPGGTKIATEL